MAYITMIEASIKLGISMELLDYFTTRCPKSGQTNILQFNTNADGLKLINETDITAYRDYLNAPWPKPPKGTRPHIPDAIKEDIKKESSYSCAICGNMNHGEIAHIEPVAETMNNSPDNLIYLCPNHHTQYDYGHKIASNIQLAEIKAAKLMKRNSRKRMMQNEHNATKALTLLMNQISKIQKNLETEDATGIRHQILTTEAQNLFKLVPQLTQTAEEQAGKDKEFNKIEQIIISSALTLNEIATSIVGATDTNRVSQMIVSAAEKVKEILIDIDDIPCPHCGGNGQTGLVGDLCSYCTGSCLITKDQANNYDPQRIDEVNCPHCNGRGTTGLRSNFCAYCGGSCVVSTLDEEDYDLSEIDEEPCPRCDGSGQYGFQGELCPYCYGDQMVTHVKASNYDENSIDQVNCPHCTGRGILGWNSIVCAFCNGSMLISSEDAVMYDPDEVDQVSCPHCGGSGQVGINSSTCPYCEGDCVMNRDKHDNYDIEELDEVDCPHCSGRGTTGLVGDICKACDGKTTVSREFKEAYNEKYGR